MTRPAFSSRARAHRRHLGPRHVPRAGAVARLAAHVDLRPRGLVGVGLRVEALDEVGGVALGAHAVPVLGVARPVEPVGPRDPLARVEEEPALPRDVPRHRERLHPPARKADQVLLERVPAEGVGHLEHRRLPVRSLRLDQELPAVAEEPRLHPVALEDDAGEVAPHRRLGRLGHREVVVRAGPGLRLLLVAAGARRGGPRTSPRRRPAPFGAGARNDSRTR